MAHSIHTDLEKIVSTVAAVYEAEGDLDLASLLRTSSATLEQTEYDNWNGGTYTYALHLSVPARAFATIARQVETLEGVLLERFKLVTRAYGNEYLGSVIVSPMLEADLSPSTPAGRGDPVFWQAGYFRLFLSHVSTYKVQASALAAALRSFGVSAFVAHEDIEPATEWEGAIILGLNTMDALAAFLTPGFKESNWADQEVGISIGRGVLVIPIRLGLDPYGFIGKYQGFQAVSRQGADLASEMVAILSRHQLTRQKMAHALVTSFSESSSFAEARSRVRYLDLIQEVPAPLSARLRQAVSENPQIREAWGVPERVEEFLSRRTEGSS